ncbi:MAG: hypothetical protein MOIL_01621 [Candidatus Methanolliviera sp. GoM_oil]|nr:MAG: hypothetical protein MOIL_01621 [Candidatus Methanolliviera sp. GoM_oil]
MKRLLIFVLAALFLVSPVIAEFQGKKGESATYESLQNGAVSAKITFGVDGDYMIGNVITTKFIAEQKG